jgi:hypothetical protein
LGRLDAGRELLRLLAPGRVLALAAVRGLAGPPLPPFFLAVLPLPAEPPVLAEPPLPAEPPVLAEPPLRAEWPLPLAGLDALVPTAVPALGLALAALVRAVLVRAALERDVAGRLAVDRLALVRAVLVRAEVLRVVRGLAAAGRLAEVDRLAEVRAGRAAEDRDAVDRDRVPAVRDAEVRDELAARRAGVAGVAGLIADSDLAAVVRALAAVVMALVAVFIDCMAVDIVLAEVLARVAAAVILVAAEVTLVAADETVRAAVAGVVLADERRAEPEVRLAAELPAGRAVRLAVRLVVLDARPAARRAGELARAGVVPVVRAVAVWLAVRRVARVVAERVLPELAGLRRAGARVVVWSGTDFPPS